MESCDISNYTTRFSVANVQQWRKQGIGLAIIQLISGVRLAGDDCATQILKCLDGGLAVDCYMFPGNDGLPLTTEQRLAIIPDDARFEIRQLWIDIEPVSNRNASKVQISHAHTVCDAWAPWQITGDYSALWVASQVGWMLPWPWPKRKQWLVNVFNDGHPNLGGEFSGTDNHVMTQYKMDVTVDRISGMDRNLLADSEAAQVTSWLGGPTGGQMAIIVGDGIKNQMDANGDTPLCDHVFYEQPDEEGNTFTVEKVLGKKGQYVASNSSGQWEVAGPL